MSSALNNSYYKNGGTSGFTVIEMAIVVTLSSFILLTLVSAYSSYVKQQRIGMTETSLQNTNTALQIFKSVNGGIYPCPASLTDGPNSNNYGISANLTTGTPSTCENDGVGIFRVRSQRPGEWVLIGAVPFRTLETATNAAQSRLMATERMSLDGWNNKLLYVVSEKLVNTDTYEDSEGAVSIVDEHNQSLVNPAASAHMALVSHGEDGRGAYSREGLGPLIDNCGSSIWVEEDGETPPSSTQLGQRENCNHVNGVILSGLTYLRGDDYNDDIVRFLTTVNSTIWGYTGEDDQAENKNPGTVGFHTKTPQQMLHVGVNPNSQTPNAEGKIFASNIYTRRICDNQGQNCFEPRFLGGEAHTKADNPDRNPDDRENVVNTCPPGQVITKIAYNEVECVNPFEGFTLSGRSCPTGQVLVGITNVAPFIICEPL